MRGRERSDLAQQGHEEAATIATMREEAHAACQHVGLLQATSDVRWPHAGTQAAVAVAFLGAGLLGLEELGRVRERLQVVGRHEPVRHSGQVVDRLDAVGNVDQLDRASTSDACAHTHTYKQYTQPPR